jgi:hypothetical protein
MTTAAQLLTILGILCAPMITIGALVLTLAALNMSLGIRRFYVKLLAFIFVYAKQIKRDKETTIQTNRSTDDVSTSNDLPLHVDPHIDIVDRSIDMTCQTMLTHDNEQSARVEHTTTVNHLSTSTIVNDVEEKTSQTLLQNDIQFKLGNNSSSTCFIMT